MTQTHWMGIRIAVLICTTSFLILGTGYSQVYDEKCLAWVKQTGGTGDDSAASIAVDLAGNVYTTGSFQNTVDFDPGAGVFNISSLGGSDVFVSKFDATGNLIWAKAMGGTGYGSGYLITLDESDSIYIAGAFSGEADFDPGSGTYSLSDGGAFFSKLDVNGNFVWAKAIVGVQLNELDSLVVDIAGNLFITGHFQGTVNFDPGVGTFNLTSAGATDIFVSKLDMNGDFVWAKSFGGASYDFGSDVALDASGNVYVTGEFFGTADLDPGTGVFEITSGGLTDVFVSKLDINGDFVWAKAMKGEWGSLNIGYSVALDASGNVYTAGKFEGNVDFDPGPNFYNLTAINSKDIFLSKLDSNGNFVWAKDLVDSAGPSIMMDRFGSFYLTGGIGISSFEQNGDIIWTKAMEGANGSIALDSFGDIYTTGGFGYVYTTGGPGATHDFLPGDGEFNLTTFGEVDIFLAKFSSVDTTPPTITLNGSAAITLCPGGIYTEEGASASDFCDMNLPAVTVGGDTVNISVPGVYHITYNLSDASGNAAAQVTRAVTVLSTDTSRPTITLNGNATFNILKGDVYIEQGATASDFCDMNLPAVNVGGDVVDTNIPGTYIVTYNVSDVSGNAAWQRTRTVNVLTSGACCFLDGTCFKLSAANCALSGGIYQGDNTTCSDVACIPENDGETIYEIHSADLDGNHVFSLTEMLRVIQFFNLREIHCDAASEDGYNPGIGDQSCTPHSSDYNGYATNGVQISWQDWRITLDELLRVIQFVSFGGYYSCPSCDSEDGFWPVVVSVNR